MYQRNKLFLKKSQNENKLNISRWDIWMINFNKRNITILTFLITSILFSVINIFLIHCNLNKNFKGQNIYILNENLNQIQ